MVAFSKDKLWESERRVQ